MRVVSGELVANRQVVARSGFHGGEGGREDRGDSHPGPASEAIRDALIEELQRVGTIILQRHNKYGPKNIANAPGGPITGILVRLHDKMSRLTFGMDNHEDESVDDAFTDVAGYALIGLMVRHGKWPGA